MSNSAQAGTKQKGGIAVTNVAPQQRVLNALQAGARDWEYLKLTAKLNDERLGLTLNALLNDRLIWTVQRDDVRLYGLELRRGLVPRFAHPQRRETDKQR